MKTNFIANTQGLRDGIPIGLGYLAVSFSLGIVARNVGLTAFEGFLASLVTIASAGEYAAFTLIGEAGSYLSMALVIFVANCRYLLMSCALSQKLSPGERLPHRVGVGAFVTDEIFSAGISRFGYLNPYYTYGLATVSVPPWAVGTSLGIIAGNLLPEKIVLALGVALYGMFIKATVPAIKESKVIAGVILISYAVSLAGELIPFTAAMSAGVRIAVFTIIIAAAAALLFPVKEEEDHE